MNTKTKMKLLVVGTTVAIGTASIVGLSTIEAQSNVKTLDYVEPTQNSKEDAETVMNLEAGEGFTYQDEKHAEAVHEQLEKEYEGQRVEADNLDLSFENNKIMNSEFNSLDSFVEAMAERIEDGSNYRAESYSELDAEGSIGFDAYHNSDYFKDQIAQRGLTEEFEELKSISKQLANDTQEKDKHQEAFQTKINQIQSKL